MNVEITCPVPVIGVAGVVFNQSNEVLLIRRKYPPREGLWSIPGGKQEAGETLIEACVREIQEETGLWVRVMNVVAVVERRDAQFHYVIIDFLAELLDGQDHSPEAQSDVSDAQWVNLNSLSDLSMVEGLHSIIIRAQRNVQQRKLAGLHDVEGLGTDFIQVI